MEWIPEIVLQKYVKDNMEKFSDYFEGKITYVEWNNDRYPDLVFVIDNKIRIPVEVEWKTSNFRKHKHDPEVLSQGKGYDAKGLLFVGKIEPNEDIGNIRQVELSLTDFEKWFSQVSSTLAKETTKDLHKIDATRKLPKLWFTYLSFKGDGVLHFETALRHQVWGVQKNYRPTTNNQIKGIHEGDLIAFIGPGKKFPGRVPISEWTKKSFKGFFEKIRVYRVIRKYYFDETKIWKTRGKWENELFSHRFDFDRNPLITMKNIQVKNLGITTKKELHSTVYSNIRMCDPHSLVDILHNAEQLSLQESKNELDYIFKLSRKS